MYSYQLQCLTCPLTQSGASSYKCSSIRLWCTWRHQLTSRRHAPAFTSDTQPIKEGNVLRLAIWLQAINPFYRSRWVTSSHKGTASILEADTSANSIVNCKLNALSTEQSWMDDYKVIQQLGSKKAFVSRIYSRIAFVTGKPPQDFGTVDC